MSNSSTYSSVSRRLGRRQLIVASLGLGIAFRLIQYAGNRSFWMDEAFAARVYLTHTATQILNPGVFGAVAPGFYILQRAAAVSFGVTEFALRVVPLLAGLASLFLFVLLARKVLTRNGFVVAVGIFAISPFLIYYSTEAKRYAIDVACALVILLVAIQIYEKGVTVRAIAILALTGILATFFSFPATLVLAGTTLGLIVVSSRAGDWHSVRLLGGTVALAAIAVGLPLLLYVVPRGGSPSAGQAFWESGFMPLPPRSLEDLAWFSETFLTLFRDPLGAHNQQATTSGFYQPAAAMLCFSAGTLWMWSTNRDRLIILIGPIVVALIASGLGLYPFGAKWLTAGRSVLYLVPIFYLLIAEGAEQLRLLFKPHLSILGTGILAVLLIPLLVEDLVWIPYGRAEMRPVLEYVEEHLLPGDIIYVHYDAKPIVDLYATRYDFGGTVRVAGTCSRFRPFGYIQEMERFRDARRVWILFGSGVGAHGFNERAYIVDHFDRSAVRLDDRVALGASVYLYNLREYNPAGTADTRRPILAYDLAEGCDIWRD